MRAAQPADPAQVATLANHDLALDMGDSGSFVTPYYTEIDPEARDPDGRFFGKERFWAIIRREATRSAQKMVTAVFDEIGRFCRGLPYDDDITLVVIKIEE